MPAGYAVGVTVDRHLWHLISELTARSVAGRLDCQGKRRMAQHGQGGARTRGPAAEAEPSIGAGQPDPPCQATALGPMAPGTPRPATADSSTPPPRAGRHPRPPGPWSAPPDPPRPARSAAAGRSAAWSPERSPPG